jgi:hypothetical protein
MGLCSARSAVVRDRRARPGVDLGADDTSDKPLEVIVLASDSRSGCATLNKTRRMYHSSRVFRYPFN